MSFLHACKIYIPLTIEFILSQKLFEYETKIAIQRRLENTDPQLWTINIMTQLYDLIILKCNFETVLKKITNVKF